MKIYKMKIYKIRHKPTGLFSSGGFNPSLSKSGKEWNTLGQLRNHLRMFRMPNTGKFMYEYYAIHNKTHHLWSEFEVVEYTVVESEINTISLKDFL